LIDILSVVGARPNFVKIGPIAAAFLKRESVSHRVVHTGQHYSPEMSDIFFRQLELPQPDAYLQVGSGTQARQTAQIMTAFEEYVLARRPDVVLVVGDVNSTLACSLVCSKLQIPIVHVEAGLRSGDRGMPEEINRLVTDAISDLLLVSEPDGLANLKREGVPDAKIRYVGNVMLDTLVRLRKRALESPVLTEFGLTERGYVLATLHRPATVDTQEGLAAVLEIFDCVGDTPIIFPVHPRTRKNFGRFGFDGRLASMTSLKLVDPIGYLGFLRLMMGAEFVLTDSGGIQEETTFLDIPCLTLRPNTERPVTVTKGSNQLMPLDAAAVSEAIATIRAGTWKHSQAIEGWDGKAGERIAEAVLERFG
jgi:UDP-N-acetylglucosamine 2-epimerase (non-hydrolysing)